MQSRQNRMHRRSDLPDLFLLISVILLTLFGTIMIGSANGWSYDPSHFEADYLMIRQLMGIGLGLVAIFFLWICPIDLFRYSAVPLYVLSLVLLVSVLIWGQGSAEDDTVKRWVSVLGIVSIQPSELAKIVLILTYAWYFDRYKNQVSNPMVVAGAAALALVPLLLVFEEPDLSTSLVICAVAFACVFMAGMNRWIILGILAVGAIGLSLILTDATSEAPSILSEYQVNRILAWLHPEDYALTMAYQSIRSRMAIGSGGLLGKGLFHNAGTVPVATTDFIFGIIGEEVGFVGSVIIVLWIFLIAGRILSFAFRTEDLFKKIIFAGMAVLIAFQSLVHIGVNLAVLPNTGIPLPFVSYGLSSLTANMVGIGLVLRLKSEPDNKIQGGLANEYRTYRS